MMAVGSLTVLVTWNRDAHGPLASLLRLVASLPLAACRKLAVAMVPVGIPTCKESARPEIRLVVAVQDAAALKTGTLSASAMRTPGFTPITVTSNKLLANVMLVMIMLEFTLTVNNLLANIMIVMTMLELQIYLQCRCQMLRPSPCLMSMVKLTLRVTLREFALRMCRNSYQLIRQAVYIHQDLLS